MTKKQKQRQRAQAQQEAQMLAFLNTQPRRFLDPEGKQEVPFGTTAYADAPYQERFISLTQQ